MQTFSELLHMRLLVSDVESCAKWYDAEPGLQTLPDDPAIGYVALRHRAARFVVVLTKKPALPGRSSEAAGNGLDHLTLAVPDSASFERWTEYLIEARIQHADVVLEGGHPSLRLRDDDRIAIESNPL